MTENELVYSTSDHVCKECDSQLDHNLNCENCFQSNLGLIQDRDGSWYIDPALLD